MSLKEFNFNKFYQSWKFIHSLISLVGIFFVIWLDGWIIWMAAQIVVFSFLIVNIYKSLDFKPLKIGYANYITLIRLLMILILGSLFRNLDDLVLFSGFLLAILLDGVDGFLARKFKHSSNEGEIFDMEVDSLMVFILSWMHFNSNEMGLWVLVCGGLKYLNEILLFQLNKVDSLDSPKRFRSTIAVIFFISLLSPFILTIDISKIILLIACSLIFLSFGVSIGFKIIKINSSSH